MAYKLNIQSGLYYDKDGREFRKMRNTSGGTLSVETNGSLPVVRDVTATTVTTNGILHGFTTTTSQDDRAVEGVLLHTTLNNQDAYILTKGYIIEKYGEQGLRVNGTTDIAIGDDLSTYSVAGVAGKATAGKGGIFATAYEAYTTNDSAGKIKCHVDVHRQSDATSGSAPDIGLLGDMSAFPLHSANVIGVVTKYSPDDHRHKFSATDDIDLLLGASDDVALEWDTAETNDALKLGVDAVSRVFHIMDKADMGTDTTLAVQSNPTIVLWDASLADKLTMAVTTSGPTLGIDTGDSLKVTVGGTEELDISVSGLKITQNRAILDANANELLKWTSTAAAVNEITIVNNSTGVDPRIDASGETNVGIVLRPKGTGVITVDQNNEAVGLVIDTEAQTSHALNVLTPTQTTGNILNASDADLLTTGGIANLISNSSNTGTRKLLNVVNDNTAATGATVATFQQDAAIRNTFIDQNADAEAIIIDTEATTTDGLQLLAPTQTTGNIISVTAGTGLTSGDMAKLTTGAANALTTGEVLDMDHAATALSVGKTGNMASLTSARTLTGAGMTDNFHAFSISRASTANSGGQTLTEQGTVLNLINTNTQTVGTLTDSVDVLYITQDALSTGRGIFIDGNGNGRALSIDSEGTTGHSVVIAHDAATTGKGLIVTMNSADTGTRDVVNIIQDHASATGAAGLEIQQDSTADAQWIDANADGRAFAIDSEATTFGNGARTTAVIDLDVTALTTGNGLLVEASSLTSGNAVVISNGTGSGAFTGMLLDIYSNSANTGTRNLAQIHNDDGTATAVTNLKLINDANNANSALLALAAGGTSTNHIITTGTNENLRIAPNGTGFVDFVYAAVALGGGAAPTLGTIGGSGPATAGQNAWLKCAIQGTASYIPIWR